MQDVQTGLGMTKAKGISSSFLFIGHTQSEPYDTKVLGRREQLYIAMTAYRAGKEDPKFFFLLSFFLN